MAAKKAADASDDFGEGADADEPRPEDADAFGSGEGLEAATSLTSDDAADTADTADTEPEEPGPIETEDRAAQGGEDDGGPAHEGPLLRDLADADDLEPGDEPPDDLPDLDA